MSILFRSLAAAAATAFLPLAAMAEPVLPLNLNFESLVNSNQTTGVTLTNQVQGLSFSTSGGSVQAIYGGLVNFVPSNPGSPASQGYLLASNNFSIDVANDDSRFRFNALRFDFALPAAGVEVIVRLVAGSSARDTLFPSTGDFEWGHYELLPVDDPLLPGIPRSDRIDRIEFISQSGVLGLFAIDNLSFSCENDDINCTTVGVLPEPAGFGLLGLMLLSAGWSARRQRRS